MTGTPSSTLHIAIIPDGNRRWAAAHGIAPWEGHVAGSATMRQLVRRAFADGATHVTVWGSSLDNLAKRPLMETARLADVYATSLQKILDEGDDEPLKARVRVIGRWQEQFAAPLIALIRKVERATAAHTDRTLTLLLAYSGTDEMLAAVRAIAQQGIAPDAITSTTLKAHLFTHDLPPVDLVVRTGGEPHWSAGFMMWDIAEAHFHFTDTLFPDFTPDMLSAAITTFHTRERRGGK